MTSVISTAFFSVFPILIPRSIAGFSDRDPLCLLLGLASYTIFIVGKNTSNSAKQYTMAFLSGIMQMLIALTWEGCGLFSSVIIIFLLIKLLWNQFYINDYYMYLLWLAPIFCGMFFLTKTYLTLEPFSILAWGFPLYFLLISSIFYLIALKQPKSNANFNTFFPPGLFSVLAVSLIIILCIIITWIILPDSISYYILMLADNLLAIHGSTRLMQTISELYRPSAIDWVVWYDISFIIFSIGTILSIRKISQILELNLWWSISIWEIFLMGILFSHSSLISAVLPGNFSRVLYIFCFILLLMSLAIVGLRKQACLKSFDNMIFAFCYFIVMLLAARGVVKFHFYFAPFAIMFGGFTLSESIRVIQKSLFSHKIKVILYASTLMLIGLMFYVSLINSFKLTKTIIPTITPEWKKAMQWMKENLPQKSIIAAWWDYGSQINVLASKATVIDEEQFIPYWIHLFSRHVFCAQNEIEALEFLRTRNATHLIFSSLDILTSKAISAVGSDENYDRRFCVYPLIISSISNELYLKFIRKPDVSFVFKGTTYTPRNWHVEGIKVTLYKNKDIDHHRIVKTEVKLFLNGKSMSIPLKRAFIQGNEHFENLAGKEYVFPGGVILLRTQDHSKWVGAYVPEVGYNSLLVRMFLMDRYSKYFKQIYPLTEYRRSGIKIWEITYPKDMKFRDEYLVKDFDSKRLKTAWMLGK